MFETEMIACNCGPEYVQCRDFALEGSIGHSKRGSYQCNQFLQSRTHTSDSVELLGRMRISPLFSNRSRCIDRNYLGNGSIPGLQSMCSLYNCDNCALGEAEILGKS